MKLEDLFSVMMEYYYIELKVYPCHECVYKGPFTYLEIEQWANCFVKHVGLLSADSLYVVIEE